MFLCSGCGRAFNEEDGYAHLVDCPNTTGTGAQLIRIDEMEELKKKEEDKEDKEAAAAAAEAAAIEAASSNYI